MNFLLVFIGGGLGCVFRYQIGLWLQKTSTLPVATFTANLSACIIFALLVWLSTFKPVGNAHVKLLLLTGFCGGLSTFSTFGYETYLLFKQGMQLYAFLNIIINTTACLLAFHVLNSKFF